MAKEDLLENGNVLDYNGSYRIYKIYLRNRVVDSREG
jgi:hypothetical protein